MTIRWLKSVLVISIGLWICLIASGNLADPTANREFVQHVLSMDTVFADNALKSRAITDPAWQEAFFVAIVTAEWVAGLLCVVGAWRLVRARADRAAFVAAKPFAACGLVLGFLLYFVGFVAVGGEWFCSWQSAAWNGQPKAVMFLSCLMFVLLALLIAEEDDPVAGQKWKLPAPRPRARDSMAHEGIASTASPPGDR